MRYVISAATAGLVLAGCSTTSTPPAYESVPLHALTGQWQVESIDQAGIIDSSHITVRFTDDGRIVGSSGCNRYSAAITKEGDRLSIAQAVSTRMACAPALMQQEQRFFAALGETTAIYKLSDTWLVSEDADGTPRLKMIEMASQASESNDVKSWRYQCGTAGNITMKALDADRIELSIAEQIHILPQVISASGAKYGAGEIVFWQKGREALLESAGHTFECQPF